MLRWFSLKMSVLCGKKRMERMYRSRDDYLFDYGNGIYYSKNYLSGGPQYVDARC